MCLVYGNMTGVTEFGVGESQKTTGVKIVYFVFVFLFNGSMIMLRGLQISSFSMLFICLSHISHQGKSIDN